MDPAERILVNARDEGRRALLEHEIYELVRHAGGIRPPGYVFAATPGYMSERDLKGLGTAQVVLKLVSPDITHKSDTAGVAFVPNDAERVRAEAERDRAGQLR